MSGGGRGVLDTSTLILLRSMTDPSALPSEPVITAVTLAELSVGPLVASSDQDRAARQAHLQQAEADFDPLPFDARAARAFGQVAASLRRSGRKVAARSWDAMIAATALSNGLAVYTCNPTDFEGIDGLTVVAVPHPKLAQAPDAEVLVARIRARKAATTSSTSTDRILAHRDADRR